MLSETTIMKKLGIAKINIVIFQEDKVVAISKEDIQLDESGEDNRSYLFDLVHNFNGAISDKATDTKKILSQYLRDIQRLAL